LIAGRAVVDGYRQAHGGFRGRGMLLRPLPRVKLYNDCMAVDPGVILKWSLPYREEDDPRWHTYDHYAK